MKAKYVQFGVLLLLCVFADQWTKRVASDRLATTHSWIDHPIELTIGSDSDGETVEQFLLEEFSNNRPAHVRDIVHRYVTRPDGSRPGANAKLRTGDRLRVEHRKIVVIPGYFDLEYTRNPGAAFGILADRDSPWRVPFFIVVSVIAIVVITLMLRGVDRRDQLSFWALSLIAGGAIGNFIDRLEHGWVIDFIVWKYTEQYRWPTFNIADAFISVGVSLLIAQMGRDWWRERNAPELSGEDA